MYNKATKLISIAIIAVMVLSALSMITPFVNAAPSNNNVSVSTDLGNNVALISGSIGITIPNAINKNFTQSPGVVSGTVSSFPGYGVVGEQLLFQVGQATGGLPPYYYSWQFFTVGNTSFTTATGQSAYHEFNHAGVHYVVAKVTDAVGNVAQTTYKLTIYNPLKISVTASPSNIYAGQTVTFTYAISGGSGDYDVSYNLGNGQTGETGYLTLPTGSVSTTYSNPGEYLAVFQVNDYAGLTSRSTYSVNVSAAQTNATLAPLRAYTVINTMFYATKNISSIPENTQVFDTVYVTGGTGHYTYTIYWGDGASNSTSTTTNSTPFFSHSYTVPAQYIIRVYVNDSIGQSVNETEYLKVLYVPPTVELGIYNPYPILIIKNPSVFTETASNVSTGVELGGIIFNGTPSYTWDLYNSTGAMLASGTQAYQSMNFSVYDFQNDSPVPGTYHFELKITDNVGNTAYANLTIIVLSQHLQVFLVPTSETVAIGSTVHFYVYLSNVTLNATGHANVTVQFNNGTALHNITITIPFKGTPYSILYAYPSMDNITSTIWSTYHTAMNATFRVSGTFTALATSNYGTTVNTSASSPNFFTKATSIITVSTLKSISVTISTIPYPAVTHVGKPIQLFVNVTGGNGMYNIAYHAPYATVAPNSLYPGVTVSTSSQYYGNITNNYAIYSNALGTYYFNMSVNLTYQATGFFTFYGNVTNPTGITSFKFPFEVGVHILAPAQLEVTLQASSHYSYANYTTFTTYLNISGSSIPYTVNINFGGNLAYFQAYMNGTYVSSLGQTTTNVLEIGSSSNNVVGGFGVNSYAGAGVYDPATGMFYIGVYGAIYIVNPVNNTVVGTINGVPSDYYPFISNLIYVPYNGFIYATNYYGNVLVINTTSNAVQTTIGVGSGPVYALFNPSTNLIYVPNYNSNNVSVISVVNNTDFKSFSIPNNPGPSAVAYNPSNNMLYVTLFNSNEVAVMNATTGSIVTLIAVGSGPLDIAFDPSNGFIYVTNYYSSNVSVINTTTNSVQASIMVGNNPYGIIFDPSNKYMYVANYGSSNVSVIDGLSVIDSISTGSGSNPINLAYDTANGNVYVMNDNIPSATGTMTFKDTSLQPVEFKFIAEYSNINNYSQSDHMIWANVTSSYPSSSPYWENVSYDEYAIPFLQTGIISSSSTGYAPTVLSFDATPIFGEFPNMHDYSYAWYVNGTFYSNTSTSAISIPFSNAGDYTVTVLVASPVGETAMASTTVSISPSVTIVQVVSARADVTLQQIPSGNSYTAFAGPVDWNRNGNVTVSFPMPNVPHINSQYYLNVSYSYTLAVTQYHDTSPEGWYTYFYNAYSAVPYASQTITVVSGGVLLNTSVIEASINGVNTNLSIDYNNLNTLVSNGFTSVNGNLLTIKTQGSTIEAQLNSTNSQIMGISNGMVYINTTLGNVETSLSSIDAKIASVNNGIATLQTSIGNVQASLSSLNASVMNINSGIATLQTSLGYITTNLTAINAKLTSVNGTVATVSTDVGNIQTSLSSLNTQVTSISGTTATIQTDLGTLQGTVTSISGTTATIQTDLGTLQTNVKSATSGIGNTMIFEVVVLILVLITLVLAGLAMNSSNKLAKKIDEMKKQ
jgi:YVTN family beta-propeller protein